MEYTLCEKSTEIYEYIAKINKVEVEFILDKLIILGASTLLNDTINPRPFREYNIFEDNGFPYDEDETIDDYYQLLLEHKEQLSKKLNTRTAKQLNLYSADELNWSKAKDVAIDCLQDVTA